MQSPPIIHRNPKTIFISRQCCCTILRSCRPIGFREMKRLPWLWKFCTMPTSFFCSHFYTLDDHETAFMERASSTTVLQLGWLKKISLAFCGYIVLFFIACFQLFFCAVTARNCRMWWCCCYRFLSAWWLIMPSAIRFLLAGSESKRTAPKYEKTALQDARLQSERYANYAILAIALDVGFSIKASFNRF